MTQTYFCIQRIDDRIDPELIRRPDPFSDKTVPDLNLLLSRPISYGTTLLEPWKLEAEIRKWQRQHPDRIIPGQCLVCGTTFSLDLYFVDYLIPITELLLFRCAVRHAFNHHIDQGKVNRTDRKISKQSICLKAGIVSLNFPSPSCSIGPIPEKTIKLLEDSINSLFHHFRTGLLAILANSNTAE